MKSYQLAQILLANPDVELVLQKDSEGNGYSPLRGVDFDVIYLPESSWHGACYNVNWTAGDACMETKQWAALKKERKGKHAVLYPVS